MASVYCRSAIQYHLFKSVLSRTASRRTMVSWRPSPASSKISSGNVCKGFMPIVTQVRFKLLRDVYEPSPKAPVPGRKDYEDRVWKALNTFDRFPKEKNLTLDTHFINDLGLDSLDHVELIVSLEAEFNCEIPDEDAEKLMTPKLMLDYLCEKDKIPEKRTEYGEEYFKFK